MPRKKCSPRTYNNFHDLSEYARRALFMMSSSQLEKCIDEFIDKGFHPDNIVAVCIEINDRIGRILAEGLLPDINWEEMVENNSTVRLVALANRESIQGALDIINISTGNKLRQIKEFVVVVIGYGAVSIFPLENFSL